MMDSCRASTYDPTIWPLPFKLPRSEVSPWTVIRLPRWRRSTSWTWCRCTRCVRQRSPALTLISLVPHTRSLPLRADARPLTVGTPKSGTHSRKQTESRRCRARQFLTRLEPDGQLRTACVREHRWVRGGAISDHTPLGSPGLSSRTSVPAGDLGRAGRGAARLRDPRGQRALGCAHGQVVSAATHVALPCPQLGRFGHGVDEVRTPL